MCWLGRSPGAARPKIGKISRICTLRCIRKPTKPSGWESTPAVSMKASTTRIPARLCRWTSRSHISARLLRSKRRNGPPGALACVRRSWLDDGSFPPTFPGRGKFYGDMEVEASNGTDDEFTTRVKLTSIKDGTTISRTGHSLVYAGYAWRGTIQGNARLPMPLPTILAAKCAR